MALVKTLAGEKLLVQIGDGASPEVYTHDCLINGDRGAQLASDTTDTTTPDCDDPTLPGWKEVFKDGLRMTISGAGKLHTASYQTWFNWFNSDTPKNCRVKLDVAGSLGGGYLYGAFKLTALNLNGPRKDHSTIDVTLMSHGAIAWTANA